MSNNTEHDKGLEWIVNRLQNGIISHDSHNLVEPYIEIEKKYGYNGYGAIGEVDVFALYDLNNISHLLLFEYKSSLNHKLKSKAYKQLFIAKRFFEKQHFVDEVITFFVYGKYHINWVFIDEIAKNKSGFVFSIKEYSSDELKLKKYKPLGFDKGYFNSF